jgi:hypothetical protein
VKANWCDRRLVLLPCSFTLCTTPELFRATQRHLGVRPDKVAHLFACTNGARCTFFDDSDTVAPLVRPAAIVTIDGQAQLENSTGIQIAALLTHEAVHVWQHGIELLGERRPSDEFMAYGIQWVTQELLEEFAIQMGLKR